MLILTNHLSKRQQYSNTHLHNRDTTVTPGSQNDTTTNLFRRADGTLCRGLCNKLSSLLVSNTFSDATLDDSLKRSLVHRALDTPPADKNTFIISAFEDPSMINVLPLGIHRTTSAFSEFGTHPFNIGTDFLCGCTCLVVVSEEAAYMAHFL